MTTIAWVRHGETDWNKRLKIQGQSDIPLNEQGLAQARRVADRLADQRWDMIVSSDLQRAYVTAQTIRQRLRLPDLLTDARLRERGYGRLEGMTLEERQALYGTAWPEDEASIESEQRVLERGASFLNDLLRQYGGQRIIAVSHGSYIRRLLRHLLRTEDVPHLGNTSVTIVSHRGGLWEAELVNCVRHLENQSN